MAIVALALSLSGLMGWAGPAAADDRPTLKVDPATQDVTPGQEFVVNIVQSAAAATTGAQFNVNFDPKLVQMKDFALGDAYTSKSAILAFGNADLGTNATKELAMGRANKFGTLENVAGFVLPGNGTIAAGDQVFLKITFVGQPGAGGKVTIGLAKGSMIDEVGSPLNPHLVNGAVVVGAGGAVGSPGASGQPSPGPSEALSEAPAAPLSPTTPVKISVAPTSITLLAGMPARVFLIANADGNLTSAAADLTFDKDKLEITGLDVGPTWGGATLLAVSTGGSAGGLAEAIAEANRTGKLQAAGAFLPPGAQDLPYGESVFVSVLVKGKVDGTSGLSVGNAAAIGVTGETLDAVVDASSLTKTAQSVELDLTLVIPLILLAVIIAAGILIARSGRIPVRVRRRWPYYVALLLGLVPVVMFSGLVLIVLMNSAPVVTDPGVGALFGTEYSSKYSAGNAHVFGLLPALWGSVLITVVAVAVALPIALALAVIAVDFPMGPISRLVRPLIALLSGIPPIVYAVSVPFFILFLMIPKFAANSTFSTFTPAVIGADPSTWPPPGVPFSPGLIPWDVASTGNTTLLGGLVIALFLIPFLTPLFVDALRDVPRSAREASLALGANRTYTIRRVVLPRALPAILGASMLGVLKALGDTLIIAFAVGWAADRLPNPIFDVLEKTSSLATQGAGLIGSFETQGASCTPVECAVGYSGALALLLFAAVVVVVISNLQARGRRRLAL